MKAVFLDYESLDKQDLDFSQLSAAFDDLILYPSTTAEQVLARIQDVDVEISNKVIVNPEAMGQCKNLKLILIIFLKSKKKCLIKINELHFK